MGFQKYADRSLSLLLFYHPLNIYRKQVIKQADVIWHVFVR